MCYANITVVNLKKTPAGPRGVFVGRGSPLGNPFPARVKADRQKVIARYKNWLLRKYEEGDSSIHKELEKLVRMAKEPEGVQLRCYCKPLDCHGDVIKELVEALIQLEQEEA
ncbi:hypothetical protein GR28A_00121 [Vibrio phage vB_VcorM_GR28A]|nr:hypothetical protein GR28A_00121 [Vibrio phage vB_VcorM_GR28A]